ncbi:aspartate carbamoyltransferase [bacterium]|nr:aspartate carbamoyltransferase [candidate division CSSED10-310 bacterium]
MTQEGDMKGRDVLSIRDLTRQDIDYILASTNRLKDVPEKEGLLAGKVLAMLFFEPSTRTRASFTRAALNLGGRVEGFDNPRTTSLEKSESLWDTLKIYDGYGYDLFVIRHPYKGAARLASDAVSAPVINAGDGPNQHPTQTLLDLYTIMETQGAIDNLRIAMVGDLANGRTVHSLTEALLLYSGCHLYFVSSRDLAMPNHIVKRCREADNITVEEAARIEDVIQEVDILYMTRIQKERFTGYETLYEKLKSIYRLNPDMLEGVKPNLRVLHPLPRVDEIAADVDATPYAYYFPQARNGLYVRETLLALVTGVFR